MAEIYDEKIDTGCNDGQSYIPSNWWNVTGSYLSVGNDNAGFFRFINLPMSQGATIESAYFKVYTHESGDSNPVQLKIRATAEDDAAAFPCSNGTGITDPLNRTRTSAGIDFDFDGTRNVLRTSADIKTVIQEIVNRPGWEGGNAIVIVLEDDGSEYANNLWSYEYGSSKAAELIINYIGISTRQKNVTSIAKILNPPFDMGVIVTKPTYKVLTDKDPTHHIFNSDYPTLKYYTSGSIQIDLSSGDIAAIGSIEHNLGYEPYVEVYAATEIANKYQYCPYSGAGATVFYGSTFRITSTHIYFYVESTGFEEATSWYFKYFIFRNDTDL